MTKSQSFQTQMHMLNHKHMHTPSALSTAQPLPTVITASTAQTLSLLHFIKAGTEVSSQDRQICIQTDIQIDHSSTAYFKRLTHESCGITRVGPDLPVHLHQPLS